MMCYSRSHASHPRSIRTSVVQQQLFSIRKTTILHNRKTIASFAIITFHLPPFLLQARMLVDALANARR